MVKKKIKRKEKIVIGRTDIIDLPEFALHEVEAKIDTGAYTSAIHCSKIKLIKQGTKDYVSFHIPGSKIHGLGKKVFKTEDFEFKKIKSSTGHLEERIVITTDVIVFNKTIRTEFSLTDRSTMKFPVLLGRKLLNRRFIVDVSLKHLSYKNQLMIF